MDESTNESLTINVTEDHNHSVIIVKKIYEFFNESEFCDAVIVLNNISYEVNSIVLATCGEYYETALQENPLNEVKIFTFDYEGEMDYTIVSNFFKFIHAGILDVHTENLEKTLLLAKFLKADILLHYCFEHYMEILAPDNVVDSSHFPQFDFDVLLEVLSADELSVKFEKQALRAAELWLESTERNERTCSILSKIRYLYLTPECFVEKVIPLLDRCEICMNILKSFSECYLSPKRKKDQAKLSMYTPPRNHTLTLMVVGSINEKKNCIFTYNPDINRIKLFMDFRDIIDHDYSVVKYNELIVIAKRGNMHTNKSWKINLQNTEISGMNVNTLFNNFEAVVIDNYLYVCGGGHSSYNYSDIVTKWNLNDKTQHPVRAMFQSRAFFKAIAYEKKLYVFGGKPDKHTVINYVEIYDPETDEWRVTSPMNEKRQSFGIALLDKYIYVIGGNENGSAEKFDTNHEIWESIAPLPNKTCTIICATSYKGNIYCLGSTNNWIYYPSENIWKEFLCGSTASPDSKIFCVPTFHDDFI